MANTKDLKSFGLSLVGSSPTGPIYKDIEVSRVWERSCKAWEWKKLMETFDEEARKYGLTIESFKSPTHDVIVFRFYRGKT